MAKIKFEIQIPTAFDVPTAPAGTPTATVNTIGLADGSGLPCGTLSIDGHTIGWERGYLDAPTLITDPTDDCSGEYLEYPDWNEFLNLFAPDATCDGETYGQYINAVIDQASSLMHRVMNDALRASESEIRARLRA